MGKRIVISCWGSHGDLFPYIGLAVALKRRGHTPVVATNAGYRAEIEREGIEFAEAGPLIDANVANAGVEGYRRMEVMLDSAAAPAGLDPAPTIVPTESAVKLDEEIAHMAKNALRYEVLIGAFEKSLGALRLAVREGRE